jgi:hypothetical protein
MQGGTDVQSPELPFLYVFNSLLKQGNNVLIYHLVENFFPHPVSVYQVLLPQTAQMVGNGGFG